MSYAVRTHDLGRRFGAAGRSLRRIPRIPHKALVPLVVVLLFAFVFGSAISVPGGGSHHEYLVSGIFAQSMIATVPGIAVGVASDIRSGLMDRLRTLPSRAAA